MANNELVLLDQAIREAQVARDEPVADDIAFELFAAEQILKDLDVSLEEIEAGRVGGGKDGAMDGIYVFLGDVLLAEDADVLGEDTTPVSYQRDLRLTLWIIQAKTSTSFTETAVDLLSSSVGRLLDLQATEESLSELYSVEVVTRVRMFTRAWQKLASRRPQLKINVVYATRGSTTSVNERVARKAEDLESRIVGLVPAAQVSFKLVGAGELWALYNRTPTYTLQLTYQENATSGSSHAAIVRLKDYWNFIREEGGALRRHIFDWNVRDYQGDIEVNREIRDSLEDIEAPEFWWMNNGVTVICSSAQIVSKTFILDDVQVVNGLQTSHSIDEVLRNPGTPEAVRNKLLLVRILVTEDTSTRDAVIRATNRQTAVPVASLRATDEIQRQIESYFLAHDWYYDRRKNYYRNLGKPPGRIISIPFLAQAVMAGGLSSPHNSRARPSSLLKRGEDYEQVFSAGVPLSVYLWLGKLQRQVDNILSYGLGQDLRTDLRFYVTMVAVARAYGNSVYNPKQLGPLAEADTEVDADSVQLASADVLSYANDFTLQRQWRIDRAAKSREFVNYVIGQEFPLQARRNR